MKSLSRELGGPLCRAINTDEISLFKTLRQVEIELGQPGSEVEVCYQEGERSTFTLAPVDKLSQEDRPYLDSDSVVIATGGAMLFSKRLGGMGLSTGEASLDIEGLVGEIADGHAVRIRRR